MEKFYNKQTVEGPAIPPQFVPPAGPINLRDTATCDFLNRGLMSNLFTLTANYRKMRIPIRQLTPIEGGWIECIIADESGTSEDDARVVIKNYTVFTLTFGKEARHLI